MDKTKLTIDKLRTKARRKYFSNALVRGLVSLPESHMTKAYYHTFACCQTLHIDNNQELKSKYYCKNRWCQTCASIKMAIMINKYLPVFEPLKDDLYFVTLTMRTVDEFEIHDRIIQMQKMWRKIADLGRKKLDDFNGLRKTELKVGKGGGYHGHYHIIVKDEMNAKFIVSAWLRLAGTSASYLGQDCVKVNGINNALLELFKYATKCTCSEDGGNEIICTAHQMDVIFKALYKKRLFQPFGNIKAMNEDSFELTPEICNKAVGYYEWIGTDWWHTNYGQCLTGFTPEDVEIAMINWDKKHKKKPKLLK